MSAKSALVSRMRGLGDFSCLALRAREELSAVVHQLLEAPLPLGCFGELYPGCMLPEEAQCDELFGADPRSRIGSLGRRCRSTRPHTMR